MNEQTNKTEQTPTPAPEVRGENNGITYTLTRHETERVKKGEDPVMYWGVDVAQFYAAPKLTPYPANATAPQKELVDTQNSDALRAALDTQITTLVDLLGKDSDGKWVAVDMLGSKINSALLSAQKDKGKDAFDSTTKGQRAVGWFANLAVKRAVQRSPMDIAKDEMVTAMQDSAQALAKGTIDAAKHAANVQAASAAFAARITELQTAMIAQALTEATASE